MIILKQGPIYKYCGKGKWSDAWYIYSFEDDCTYFKLYKDCSVKKELESWIDMKRIAELIRFGITSRNSQMRPEKCIKDSRINDNAFISFYVQKVNKKASKLEALWLCTVSIIEMYELIKIHSECLLKMGINAPQPDPDAIYSLHNNFPFAFKPDSSWERYYDSPPNYIQFVTVTDFVNRSASVDELVENKNKTYTKNKVKKKKEISQSLSTLNHLPDDANNKYPTASESSNEQKIEKYVCAVVEKQETPMHILRKNSEISEKALIIEKPRRKSGSSNSDNTTIAVIPTNQEKAPIKVDVFPEFSSPSNNVTTQTELTMQRKVLVVCSKEDIKNTSFTNDINKNDMHLQGQLEYDEIHLVNQIEISKMIEELKEVAAIQCCSKRSDSMSENFEDAFSRTQSFIENDESDYQRIIA